MTDAPFLHAKVRVGRAKELLDTLKTEGLAFWESHPYLMLVEADPNGTTKTYKCRLAQQVPPVFDFWVIEAVDHLRTSLDYLGYAIARLAGKREPKACYFPIADTAAKLKTGVIGRGRCKDLPPDIVTFFEALEPYQGGKAGAVWVLNKLCNSGKHRFLTSVGLQSAYNEIDITKLPLGSVIHPHHWDSSKNEISYFSTPLDMEPQYKFEIAFFIAFSNVEPLTGAPVFPHLFAIADEVARVINETEIEVRRLGLI